MENDPSVIPWSSPSQFSGRPIAAGDMGMTWHSVSMDSNMSDGVSMYTFGVPPMGQLPSSNSESGTPADWAAAGFGTPGRSMSYSGAMVVQHPSSMLTPAAEQSFDATTGQYMNILPAGIAVSGFPTSGAQFAAGAVAPTTTAGVWEAQTARQQGPGVDFSNWQFPGPSTGGGTA